MNSNRLNAESRKDDGIFFMSWDDFQKYFDTVDVCYLERTINSIELDVIDEYGGLGPFFGCILGVFSSGILLLHTILLLL